jgi:hypothetical protein
MTPLRPQDLPDTIAVLSALDEIIKRQQTHERSLELLYTNLPAFDELAAILPDCSVSLYASDVSPCIFATFVFSARAFTSDANPELFAALELAEERFGAQFTCEDNPNLGYRNYALYSPLLNIVIRCHIIENEEALCRRKLIGTKKSQRYVLAEVDEPIYAFTCPE